MIVTLGALKCCTEKDRPSRVDPINHLIDPIRFRMNSRLHVAGGRPMKTGGDLLRKRCARQQIAGQLLNRKLVERHAGVECLNHPVAIRPTVPQLIRLKPVGVGVPRKVQPASRPFFTVLRTYQQPIHQTLELARSRVGEERLALPRLRGSPNQVKVDPAQLPLRLGQARKLETGLGQAKLDEGIDWVAQILQLGQAGQFRTLWPLVRPMSNRRVRSQRGKQWQEAKQ